MPSKKESSSSSEINVKVLEVISKLVLDQNKQLLRIICKDENLDYDDVKVVLGTMADIRKSLHKVLR